MGTPEKQLVRFARILRLRLTANTRQGIQLLVEYRPSNLRVGIQLNDQNQSRGRRARTSTMENPRPVATTLCIDEVDVYVSLTEYLFDVFGLSPTWQEQNVRIG